MGFPAPFSIMRIEVKYKYGEEVILRTDPGTIRVVSGYLLRPGTIQYGLVSGENETWHQEMEIRKLGLFKVKGFAKEKK